MGTVLLDLLHHRRHLAMQFRVANASSTSSYSQPKTQRSRGSKHDSNRRLPQGGRPTHKAQTKSEAATAPQTTKQMTQARPRNTSKILRPKCYHKGNQKRYFTWVGGFNLACRRAAAHGAAWTLGLSAGLDISHPTMAKYEIRLRAALKASHRFFSLGSEVAMHLHACDESTAGHMYRIMSISGDATNAKIWQECSLHTTEMSLTMTGAPVFEDSTFEAVCENLVSRNMLGDLQIVGDKTAGGTLAIASKGLANNCMPTPWALNSREQLAIKSLAKAEKW